MGQIRPEDAMLLGSGTTGHKPDSPHGSFTSMRYSKRKLKMRNRELAMLMELSNLLASSTKLQDLLTEALKRILPFFQLDAGRIYLKEENSSVLTLTAHQGIRPDGLTEVDVNEGFTGLSARTMSFLSRRVEELEDQDRAALLKERGLKTIICVPLIAWNTVWGVMNLGSKKEVDLSQEKVDLLTAMGNQIAVTANNARLHDDLIQKIQILKEKKEMIKFYAYSVSHDLKSPAIGLYGLARRLKKICGDQLDAKGKAYCDQIEKTAGLMVDLVEKINEYMKARELSLRFEEFNFGDILDIIRDEFAPILKKRNISWHQPSSLPMVTGDKVSFLRVFRNFADNALKYGGDMIRSITVNYKENGRFHIFSFRDDGPGMEKGETEKIFEVFHRRAATRHISGSGLGLAIVKEIAERHQGSVRVESRPGQGTTFYFLIPKSPVPDSASTIH